MKPHTLNEHLATLTGERLGSRVTGICSRPTTPDKPACHTVCLLVLATALPLASAQSLSDALDMPNREWHLITETGMTAEVTDDPEVALDGVDAVVFATAAAGAKAVLSTRIVGPAVVRWRKRGFLDVALGSDAPAMVHDSAILTSGPQRLMLTMTGSGVLDQVMIFDASVPASLADVLSQPGVEWSQDGAAPWRVLTHAGDVEQHLLLSPRLSSLSSPSTATASLRAIFTGSRLLTLRRSGPSSFAMTEEKPTPRTLDPWVVPGDGQHEVRLDFTYVSAPNIIYGYAIVEAAEFTTPPDLGVTMGLEGIAWSTAPARPWMAVPADVRGDGGGVEISSAPVRDGETSWLEARLTGPGVLRFRSTESDLNQHLSTIWRVNGVPASLMSNLFHVNVAYFPAGDHVVRWEASAPDGSRLLENIIRLREMEWLPSAAPTIADVATADGATAFAWVTTDCGEGRTWSVAADGARLALRKESDCLDPLRWMVPGPGTVTASWQTTGITPATATLSGPKLASYGSGPSGFYNWTEVLGAVGVRLPVTPAGHPEPLRAAWTGLSTGGAAVWLDDLAWSPAPTVSLEEAVDRPGRIWTTGGAAAGLIRGLSAPVVVGANEGDAVVISGLQAGETAWMETTIAGPAAFLANVSSTHRGVRLVVDGVPVGHVVSPDYASTSRAAFWLPALNIQLPPGSHTLRFEAQGRPSWRAGDVAIIDKVSVIGASVAAVAELLDTPTQAWAAHGFSLGALMAAQAHDGQDALVLTGHGDTMLNTVVNGPGFFSLWWRPHNAPGPGATFRATLNDREAIALDTGSTTWSQLVLPVPDGRHEIALRGGGPGQSFALDEAAFAPLVPVALADALDLSVGSFAPGPPGALVSAAMPSLASDGTDAVLLLDRWAHGQFQWTPPGPGRLVYKARSLNIQGSYIRAGPGSDRSVNFRRFDTFDYAVTSSLAPVTFTISGAPVLFDDFVFLPDTAQSPSADQVYEFWLVTQGLTLAQAPPDGDYDGDGLTNAIEHAFGLSATVPDAEKVSTASERGLPRVEVIADVATGQSFLEISFVGPGGTRVPTMQYRVESADGPANDPLSAWRLSPVRLTTSSAPGGMIRYRWRSPDPVTPGTQQFVRVRAVFE